VGAGVGATKEGKMAPFSRKRHQIGHLDFGSFRLLTDRLQVQILPGEPTPDFSIIWISREHSVFHRKILLGAPWSASHLPREHLLPKRRH
jgi:hypothetical protein